MTDALRWPTLPIGEVADLNWGDTRTTKAAYVREGFSAYSATGPDGFLPWADFDRTGVVISAIGAQCGKSWLAQGKWSCIKNTLRYFSTDVRADTEFLYWTTREPSSWPKRGSAQPFISQADARLVKVQLPPIQVQRAITSMLGALESKIKSNRRAIAISSALLDAMSSSFALDRESVPLEAIAEPARDTFEPALLGAALIDHFSIPFFDEKGRPDRTLASSVISAKLRVDQPSVLVSRLNPKTNRTWYAVPEAGVTAGCSTEFLVLKPRGGVTLGSLWLAVRDEGFRSLLAQRVTGTSGSHQRVKPRDALDTDVPDVRQLSPADAAVADELLWLMHQRRVEIAKLAALRDALLPELLSGRIRVPEASDAVADVLA